MAHQHALSDAAATVADDDYLGTLAVRLFRLVVGLFGGWAYAETLVGGVCVIVLAFATMHAYDRTMGFVRSIGARLVALALLAALTTLLGVCTWRTLTFVYARGRAAPGPPALTGGHRYTRTSGGAVVRARVVAAVDGGSAYVRATSAYETLTGTFGRLWFGGGGK